MGTEVRVLGEVEEERKDQASLERERTSLKKAWAGAGTGSDNLLLSSVAARSTAMVLWTLLAGLPLVTRCHDGADAYSEWTEFCM